MASNMKLLEELRLDPQKLAVEMVAGEAMHFKPPAIYLYEEAEAEAEQEDTGEPQ